MPSSVLTESTFLAPSTTVEDKGIWRSQLIRADVQGSSGFYPAEVLERDGPSAFPAGTHIYYDHPSLREEDERPERSVRDIAGYLIDGAQYEDGPDGHGLFARVQFTEDAGKLVNTLAPIVGLSIRASGDIESTPTGLVVRSINQGISVDLVTRAGAGGRLVNMSESNNSENGQEGRSAVDPKGGEVPSTLGSGSLLNEITALKAIISESMQEHSVEVARFGQQLGEMRQTADKLMRENRNLTETVNFLRERQEDMDTKVRENKSIGDRLAEILESRLPISSQIRVAQTHRLDQDLHEAITQEREHVKKILRESERSSLSGRSDSSGLGLSESTNNDSRSSSAISTSISDGDVAQMETLLSGGLY